MELTEDYKKEVVGPMKSKRVFVFGDGGRRRSEGKYIIPTDINGQRRTLELDVIRADIPLLLSTAEMKNLDMAVDMTREEIRIMGETKKLILTVAVIPLLPVHQCGQCWFSPVERSFGRTSHLPQVRQCVRQVRAHQTSHV